MDAESGVAGDDEPTRAVPSHHLLRPRYPDMSVMRGSGVRAASRYPLLFLVTSD